MLKKNEKSNISILIIGAGSWGTTLAIMLAQKGYNIKIWVRSHESCEEIKSKRKNSKYTGSIIIPENVLPFNDKNDLINSDIDFVIFAVPTHVLREIAGIFYDKLLDNSKNIKSVINVAKGLEINTNLRMSEVLEQSLPEKLKNKIAVLSGPNISSEIAINLPSVSVISSLNHNILNILQSIFSTQYFRIYTNNDIIGVEIGGAVKNIIAIAAGISDGLGYGANAKASLITRGLYELSKIGVTLGANPQTFTGAAGMGDIIATCISKKSRNRSIGERLANGEKINDIIESMYMIAEGINTTKAIFKMSKIKKIDVPITESVYNIIYKGLDPLESVNNLMGRKFKSEV